jgi:sugar (pentulose or hexulose) kinase
MQLINRSYKGSSTRLEEYILAIDHGTQSVRALLFDLNGNLVARSRIAIEPYYSVQPGWAEQRPEYFWESLCRACQQLWQITDISKSAIKAGVDHSKSYDD